MANEVYEVTGANKIAIDALLGIMQRIAVEQNETNNAILELLSRSLPEGHSISEYEILVNPNTNRLTGLRKKA